MIVVRVLIVAREAHGSRERLGNWGKVAAFAEGEIPPTVLKPGGILHGNRKTSEFAFEIPRLVNGNFLRRLVNDQKEHRSIRELACSLVGVKGFPLRVDIV